MQPMSSPGWEDDQFDPAYWEEHLWLEGDQELDLRKQQPNNEEMPEGYLEDE
jgi:hypothetical protein